jgi:uncharacterized protein (TIRG00374 family)
VKRPRIGGLLRLTVASVLLGYLFWRANPQDVWQAAARASWRPLVVAIGLVLVDRSLMAYRWLVLLRPLEGRNLPPFGTILRIFFVSSFVGTFLPGSVGGDAVRAYSLSTCRVPIADSLASVFVDRMLGVFSLLLMALAGLTLARDLAGDQGVLLGLAVAAVACAVAAVFVFSNAADAVAEKLLARLPIEKVRRAPGLLFAAIRRYSAHRGALGNVLLVSLVVQVLRVIQAYYLGVAIGIQQPLFVYFAFVPLILLIMLLPVTANGIGTSQAAFIWFFGRVGTPTHEAFVLSVLFVALGIVGNIPGALFYISRPFRGTSPVGGMQ